LKRNGIKIPEQGFFFVSANDGLFSGGTGHS
jgi:hypothetical protein